MRSLTVSFGGSVAFNGQTRRLSCVCLSLPAQCNVELWNSATSFALPCIIVTKSTSYPPVMLPRYWQTFQAGVWMAPGVNLGPNAFVFSTDCSMSFLQYFFRRPWTYIGTVPSKKFNMKYTCSALTFNSVHSALFWEIMQRIVVTPYRRFGTTYRSHLQGARFLVPWRWWQRFWKRQWAYRPCLMVMIMLTV